MSNIYNSVLLNNCYRIMESCIDLPHALLQGRRLLERESHEKLYGSSSLVP